MAFSKFGHFSFLIIALSYLALHAAPGRAQMDQQPIPSPPTNISALERGKTVWVKWNNVTAPDVTEFHLFRIENYSPDTTLKTVAVISHNTATPAVVLYNDLSALPNRTYTYFLTTKNAFGTQSANSKIATIATSAKLLVKKLER